MTSAVDQRPSTLTARWIVPVHGNPLAGGTITIGADRILAVEPHGRRFPRLDLGEVAILPGLVNAHAHLDLSDLRGRDLPAPDFVRWLQAIVRHRRGQSALDVESAIRSGIAECTRFGTTMVGDISSQGKSWPLLCDAPLRAVVFYELLGITRGRADSVWSDAFAWLSNRSPQATCRPGLTPHAPYSVRKSLLQCAASFASKHSLPLAIHVAESQEELDVLQSRSGPLVEFLSTLGAWEPKALVNGLQEALNVVAEVDRLLLIHGNYLDPSHPSLRQATIVYCPRSHARFRHPLHPFQEFARAGVRVALGTDGLGSTPDLDVLAEARFLHQAHPEVPPEAILAMITIGGADGLGWGHEAGTLEPGKSADLIAVPLPATENPRKGLLESADPPREVMFRGRWIFAAPSSPVRAGSNAAWP